MTLTSWQFYAFFAASLVIYYVTPKRFRWYTLLGFSAFFFIQSLDQPLTGLWILPNIVATWLAAMGIERSQQSGEKKRAAGWLWLGLGVDLGLLAALKYTNFLVLNWNIFKQLAHLGEPTGYLTIPAPIGISFYTLISVGYLLDVYWGITKAQSDPLKTALFIGYFPQMTSGPVSRYEQVRESLFAGYGFSYDRLAMGAQRMLWGVFKKMVISPRAAVFVDTIYAAPEQYPGLYIWVAAAMFMLQLYTDFSGCMDIILGASECYGIQLPENFRTPFFARNVQEYWQRWHITLGAWLKDYLLYPILRTKLWRNMGKKLKAKFGKKASKQIPSYLGMLCVWLLIGLWHGGAWKYVAGMGLWFWFWIVMEQVTAPAVQKMNQKLGVDMDSFSYHLAQSLWTFVLVVIGNMFFRLNSLSHALSTIKIGFSTWNPWIFFNGSFTKMLSGVDQNILVVGILLLFVVGIVQETQGSARVWIQKQILPFRWLIWLTLLLVILTEGYYGPGYNAAEFIYRGF